MMKKLAKWFKELSKKKKIVLIAGLAAIPVVAVVITVPVVLLANQGDENDYDGGSLQSPADQNTDLAYARAWLGQTGVTVLPMETFTNNKAESMTDKAQISETLGIDLQEVSDEVTISVSKPAGSNVVSYEITSGSQTDYVVKAVSRSLQDEKMVQAFIAGLGSLKVTRLTQAAMKAMNVPEKTPWSEDTGIVFPASAQSFKITYFKPYGEVTFYLDVGYGKASVQTAVSPTTWGGTDDQVNAQKDLVSLMLVNTSSIDERTFITKSVPANTALDQSDLGIGLPAEITDASGITVQKSKTLASDWKDQGCYEVTYSVIRGAVTVSGTGRISFFQEPATKDDNYISKELLKRVWRTNLSSAAYTSLKVENKKPVAEAQLGIYLAEGITLPKITGLKDPNNQNVYFWFWKTPSYAANDLVDYLATTVSVFDTPTAPGMAP